MYELAVPKHWQHFQTMVCDLLKEKYPNHVVEEFGSNGQSQYGIDILARTRTSDEVIGYQVKRVEKLSYELISKEIVKAKEFEFEFDRYVIITTLKRDQNLQRDVVRLSREKFFPIEIVFWEDFIVELTNYKTLISKYYGDLVVLASATNAPGKFVRVTIDHTYFELLITKMPREDHYYGGDTLLISCIQSGKCITYDIGDYPYRLKEIFTGLYDAFCVCKWLRSLGNIEEFLESTKNNYVFSVNREDYNRFKNGSDF